ncbi:Crp/Fnr family transcriptional regulator [Cesiribacter andamanensis]|uniref:Cyclic nucleotide-binding domain protein n=1 Tax=Cesiribacter andamanensis AMV16 TaxID=1279009 RepID=M7NGS7_9BACT|nr:Crp/Fnr family transcriptional regulator [Cesiribacter andamanensis]EMR01035.1 Cyclic nucleotide-binding domain protein [Cesiribacter andamanensis AMV16]
MIPEAFASYLRSFLPLSDEQLQLLAPLISPRQAEKGKILLRVGEICTYTCFVVQGCLRSYVIDEGGKEHIIQFAPENWWISEQVSLLKKEPALYFIDALEDTSYLALDPQFFPEFGRLVPGAADFSAKLQLNRLHSFQKRLVSHLSASGEQRYLSFIRTYPSLALRLPQKMIAAYLGITPESLSRIRKSLALQ